MQVREFVEKAFKHVGIEIDWQGERGSVDEVRTVGFGPPALCICMS